MGLPSHNRILGLVLACLTLPFAQAQTPANPADSLIAEVAARSELMPNLEALCDGIGPRMTGSPGLAAAQAWAMTSLRRYGAVDVHLEAYELGRPWRRGPASARLLNASGIALDIVQQAWTDGTAGVIKADVAPLEARTLAELRAAAPALKGKIVLMLARPAPSAEQRKDMARYRAALKQAIGQAGFAVVLSVSGREGSLLDMWGGPDSPLTRSSAIISREHAALLQRLLARGVRPRVEMRLAGGFGKLPVKAYNVVADLPGGELDDEMVIIGAHLDSWDLATGTTDNGTGTVVMMEVLRAMRGAGLQPRRRLRVVLFSGEEQGLLGSKAYLAAHHAERGAIQAVLVQDAGAGRISGFLDMKVEAWYAALTSATAAAAPVGGADVVYALGRGSDHATFFDAGIPAFPAVQDRLDYVSRTQHSQVDSVDHVKQEDLVQGAQVMALTAWGLLNGERLPHQPPRQP